MDPAPSVKAPLLVSSDWLRLPEHFKLIGSEIILLEVAWNHAAGYEIYTKEHIPGALFLPLNRGVVNPDDYIPRGFPEKEAFAEHMRELGVNSTSHVILYDRNPAVIWAARAWFTFKLLGHHNVSLLDGGWHNWIQEGACREAGNAAHNRKFMAGDFSAGSEGRSEAWLASFSSVRDACLSRRRQLIDTRYPENFTGRAPEPSPVTCKAYADIERPLPGVLRAGHIPHAVNLPEARLLDPATHRFLPPHQITRVFRDAGVDVTKPITTMCYNGIKACTVVIATLLIGQEDVDLYAGSWTEWGQKADAKDCIID